MENLQAWLQRVLGNQINSGTDWKVAKDEHNWTALHHAVRTDQLGFVRLILSNGVDPNVKADHGLTPLHQLVIGPKRHFTELLNLLITKGADINARNQDGNNVLFLAVIQGRTFHELGQLIEYGAEWKTSNRLGHSILYTASVIANIDAIKLFLSKGENINGKCYHDFTPIHGAAFSGRNFADLLTVLMENGADINAVADNGNNALLLAATNPYRNSKRDFELLVEQGCNWKIVNKNGETIVHILARKGNIDVLRYIVESVKAGVNAKAVHDRTPLHHAVSAQVNRFETMNLLLDNGANINAMDKDGYTPFSFAVLAQMPRQELNELLSRGADCKVIAKDGKSVLHLAAQVGQFEMLPLFISKGVNVNKLDNNQRTALHLVAQAKENFMEIVIALVVEAGVDINAVDIDGNNLLFLAMCNGKSKEELEKLVEYGGNWKERNFRGESILHLAARLGYAEVVKYFISKGADVRAETHDRTTVISSAIYSGAHGTNEVCNVLLERGAVMSETDKIMLESKRQAALEHSAAETLYSFSFHSHAIKNARN